MHLKTYFSAFYNVLLFLFVLLQSPFVFHGICCRCARGLLHPYHPLPCSLSLSYWVTADDQRNPWNDSINFTIGICVRACTDSFRLLLYSSYSYFASIPSLSYCAAFIRFVLKSVREILHRMFCTHKLCNMCVATVAELHTKMWICTDF